MAFPNNAFAKESLLLLFLTATFFTYAQNVGIGTTAPVARLHVSDSSVLFSAIGDIPVTPGNTPISNAGRRMMWYPDKAAFRAGYVNASQWNQPNIGFYSFAVGNRTIASGNNSASLGFGATASGTTSFAFGDAATASGYNSTAIGTITIASGWYSTAIGVGVNAKALGAISLGVLNDDSDNPNSGITAINDRIFQIGNGDANTSTRTNAITVLRNGNTGIGTVLPLARLHVTDSSILFSAVGDVPATPGNTPISGAGRRMMWYSDKAAFRVGYVFGTEWDINNIGIYSFASGTGTRASGISSTATGFYTKAFGHYSTAMGQATIANGFISVATGNETTASGALSTAMGNHTEAKAHGAVCTGESNDITDNPDPNEPAPTDRIFQIGNGGGSTRSNAITILRNGNTGIGTVNPNAPLQFANSVSNRKIVLWEGTNNDHQFYGFGINGSTLRYQTPSSGDAHVFYSGASNTASAELFRIKGDGNVGVGVDPAFRLDVGARMRIRSTPGNSAGLWLNNDANNASPAFIGMRSDNEVGFYGQTGTFGWRFYVNTTDGNAWLQGTLTQTSDARLKKDIVPLQNPLQKIIQLNGYTYRWKDEQLDKSLQTGVLAQEVQKLFPELVTENKDGILAVNYSGLIPVMIESIKEQQQIIERQQKQIDDLKKMFERILKNNQQVK